MKHILIGTASWTDKCLIEFGHFYATKRNTPEHTRPCYARQFPLVEVDSDYEAGDFDSSA